MKHQNVSYFAVGLFVLAMLAVLIAVLAYLTGRTGPTDRYHVYYGNVAGVVSGTPVSYEGYPIGRVETVVPERGAAGVRYRVELAVQQGWSIPRDSVARVVASGLLSAITVDIQEGQDKTALAPGNEIAGREGGNLFAALSSVAGEVGELSREGLRPLLNNLNRRIDGILTQLDEDGPALIVHLRNAAAQLDTGVADLLGRVGTLTDRLNASAADLRELVGPDNRAHIEAFVAQMDRSSRNFESLSAELRSSQQKLDSLLAHSEAIVSGNRPEIEQTLIDLRASLQEVSSRVGTVAHNLEGTSRNMLEFSREIRQNPGVLLNATPPPDTARP